MRRVRVELKHSGRYMDSTRDPAGDAPLVGFADVDNERAVSEITGRLCRVEVLDLAGGVSNEFGGGRHGSSSASDAECSESNARYALMRHHCAGLRSTCGRPNPPTICTCWWSGCSGRSPWSATASR